MIKGILKYSAAAALGYAYGKSKNDSSVSESYGDVDVFQGETRTVELHVDEGNEILGNIRYFLDNNDYQDYYFAANDLKDIRREISHALSDADDNDEEIIEIELCERAIIRYTETAVNSELDRIPASDSLITDGPRGFIEWD